MNTSLLKNLSALLLLLTLLGCATPMPTLEFTPTDVVPSGKKVDADLKSISISIALEKERLGETQVGVGGNVYEQSFKTALKTALEEGLARSAVFSDLSTRKVSLAAKVLKFQTPGAGINFKTEMIVRYELIDRNNGKIVFSENVTSLGSVPGMYAFVGATRFTEARNVTVRENVKNLISKLEQTSFPRD